MEQSTVETLLMRGPEDDDDIQRTDTDPPAGTVMDDNGDFPLE